MDKSSGPSNRSGEDQNVDLCTGVKMHSFRLHMNKL